MYHFYYQMKWWKTCYSQEYSQYYPISPQCHRTKSLTVSDKTKYNSGNISSSSFDSQYCGSGFQSRESGYLSKTSTLHSPKNEVCIKYFI